MSASGEVPAGLLTKTGYAAHRGCSQAYISKLIKLGRLAAPALLDSGLINVALADQMLGGTDRAEIALPITDQADSTFAAERKRREAAQASLAEMELARRRGELIPRAAVVAAADVVFARAVAALLKVPAAVAVDLMAMTDSAAIEHRLTAALRQALGDINREFLDDAERRSAA